jgi:3-methyladenine DNA glycosylase AlkD
MNVLLTEMLSHADPSQVDGLSRFFKTGPGQYGEGDKFLGIKVPVTREVVKGCWRALDFADLEECVSSEYHEVRLAALLALVEIFAHVDKRPRVKPGVTETIKPGVTETIKPGVTETIKSGVTETIKSGVTETIKSGVMATKLDDTSFRTRSGISRESCVDFYLAHTRYINNWDLVDLSCYPLLGVWLLDKDRALLYELARNGKTIWEQRIGIVSTMTFIRHGQLSDTFAIADILLHHPHDLIQKAVGWLLREAGKRDKAALETWLQEIPGQARDDEGGQARDDEGGQARDDVSVMPGRDRASLIPRTMLRYAIEKFPEDERQRYLRG